ncbi:MAG: DUF1501 domain-containing protein [Planctomycetes bacterium]|nr:DUF1501 domain-containing protein [Planctomycetota bacterium]
MHLTRRFFLQSTGALSAYLGVAPLDLLAAGNLVVPVKRNRTLVVIFLRGGADGLNLVVPYGDESYSDLRRGIAIPEPQPESAGGGGAIDLDGYFALHPRLAALEPLFDRDLAVAAHAVGYAQNTRSHFEEQDVWETGVIGNTVNSDGWVNRHLATSEGHGHIRAVAIGDALPRIMYGKAPAYAVRGIEDLTVPTARPEDAAAVAAALEHAYCANPSEHRGAARDLLAQTAGATLEGVRRLREITKDPYQPRSQYPNTELARKLMQIARLIKADVGLEVAEIDYGGWDTHQNQGGVGGQFGNLTGQLGGALAAFAMDLEDQMDDVLVVTLTDFGRTAAENGTGGTDHGWANCMFVVGGAVQRASRAAASAGNERKVVTDWPGLAPDQLHEGRDLLHTTDFRDVLAELVRVHLGNANLEKVLPNHEVKPVGLIA